MTEPWHGTDAETLLAELGDALRSSAEPPPEVVEASKALFAWRTIDTELATLTFDSLLDDAAAGARSAAQPRILTFEAEGLTVEVELDAAPTGRRLLGQLVPAQAAELEVLGVEPSVTTTADAVGRFVVGLPDPRARVRLRIRPAHGPAVDTTWVTL